MMNKKDPKYILLFIILISLVFGVAISAVHYLTLPMLKKNEALHRNRIIAQAFLLDVNGDSPQDYETAIQENIVSDSIKVGERTVDLFRHKKNNTVGFVFRGLGFWEPISGIIVMDKTLNKIVHLKILDQKETPGLGARIEEKWFTDQFKGLPIKWQEAQKIIIGSTANADKSNVVNAITGASQTSVALMNMLNENLTEFKKSFEKRG